MLNHHGVASRRAEFFDEPEAFLPERWLRDSPLRASIKHNFAAAPFGFGPRRCLGKKYAEQEMQLVLAKVRN